MTSNYSRLDLREITRSTPTDRLRFLSEAARIIEQSWRMAAKRTFSPDTSTAYNDGIRRLEVTEKKAVIGLMGTVPNMYEQGLGPGGVGTVGPYDIRDFVLKAGTINLRRYDSTGKMYVNVPFEHSAASIARLGGEPALMAAEQLEASKTRPDPNSATVLNGRRVSTKWGGRLAGKQFPSRLQGLVRMHHVYSQASKATGGESSFRNWRRMSESPHGRPWWHPGIKAANLAASVVADASWRLEGIW
jgi:hypothetical protein